MDFPTGATSRPASPRAGPYITHLGAPGGASVASLAGSFEPRASPQVGRIAVHRARCTQRSNNSDFPGNLLPFRVLSGAFTSRFSIPAAVDVIPRRI